MELIDRTSTVRETSDFGYWIIVSGLTTTGEPFSTKVSVHFRAVPQSTAKRPHSLRMAA